MACNGTFYSNPPIGRLYIFHGSLYLIPYVLCMCAMYKESLRKFPCFKIMIAMGYIDLANLFVASILSGFMSCNGLQFCPSSFYLGKVSGALCASLWMTYTALCMALAINRYSELGGSSDKYFGGKKAWHWVVGCFVYGLCYFTFYMSPWGFMVYHAGKGQYILTDQLSLFPSAVSSVLVPPAIIAIYSMLGVRYYKLKQLSDESPGTESSEMACRMLLTAFLIGFFAATVSLSYLVAPLFEKRYPAVMVGAQIWWQLCHGSNCVIYLAINKTIRKAVLQLFGKHNQVQPIHVTANQA